MKNIKRLLLVLCIALAGGSVQAQECEPMLEAANIAFNQRNYQEALNQCRIIERNSACMSRIGADVRNLKSRCEHEIARLSEEEDYRNCNTVAGCDRYLNAHPNGRHAAQVRERRAELRRAAELAASSNEETLYRQCNSLSACDEYLRRYPRGRFVDNVRQKKRRFEQERLEQEETEAFRSIRTLYDCEEYLEHYPHGSHRSRVVARRNELQARAREAERTAYMEILQVEFANADAQRNILNDYGFRMVSSDIRYLLPRIVYDGIGVENKYVTLDFKIVNPNGSVQSASGSPRGFTYSKSFWVLTGADNTCELPAWGNAQGGVFLPGEYGFEVWYDDRMIYNTTFTVRGRDGSSGTGSSSDRSSLLFLGNWRSSLGECQVNGSTEWGDGYYKGQVTEGRPAGIGMYGWYNGSYYIGQWRSGNPSGMGVFISPPDGDFGDSDTPNCAYYVGEWSNGRRSGTGNCYDRFGNAIYHGNFSNDRPTQSYPMSGFDAYKFLCIRYDDGRYYVGETVNGTPQGTGVMIWPNGNLWFGNFANGQRNGGGALIPDDGPVTTGTWRGDRRQ